MTASAVIVGRGPAGLLSTELLMEGGYQVTIVAEADGTLAMWPGDLSFGKEAISYLEFPIRLGKEEWAKKFSWFEAIMDNIGVAMLRAGGNSIPKTVTAIGLPRPTYSYPSWLYASVEVEDLIFIGIGGLADSIPEAQAASYTRISGKLACGATLARPPGWTSDWGALRFASFLDQPDGAEWLAAGLQSALKGLPEGFPILLPQVIGLENTIPILSQLTNLLGRRVAEYPLVSPSISGVRIRDRWLERLRAAGVRFLSGSVARATPDGELELSDGRSLNPDLVVLATGGVLGGGITIELDTRAIDKISNRQLGVVESLDDLDSIGHLDPYPIGGNQVVTVGRQAGGWSPDRNQCGGAMLLATVTEALNPLLGGKVEAI